MSATSTNETYWYCGHTKKCGWHGPDSELVHVEDKRRFAEVALKCTVGTCPKCGSKKFYLRKRPTNSTTP